MMSQKKNYKKIVIFIPSIEFGGVEKNFYILIDYLKKIYPQIFIVTSSKLTKKIDKKKIKIINPKQDFWYFKKRFFKNIISSFLLIKNFKKNDVLIISFQANIFSIILSRLMNWPIIIRLNTSPEKYINNIFKLSFFKSFYKLSNEIIVNSFEFKKNLKLTLNLNSTVILNPILKKKNKNNKLNFFKNFRGLKIINIARLTDQKDHLTLLKAAKMISEKNKINFRLSIIGKGKNFQILQNFIIKNKLKKKVFLCGYKKDAEQYLSYADLFILTSKFEGLPNTLIEAQTAKLPIISSNCPTGPKEILLNGKLGMLFKNGSYKDLYKKVLNFHNNKIKYKTKALLAQKFLKRFDYKINLSKYNKIINKHI